jgi:ATP-dependent DNA ligase
LPRSAGTAPVPRYRPMLAGPVLAPSSDGSWLFEITWDGVQAIATVGTPVSLKSRTGTELAGQFPNLAEITVCQTRPKTT